MRVDILFPRLGKVGMEATVSRWLKSEGEYVRVGEPLVELTTEKATIELAAACSGILANLSQPGEVRVAGDTLGSIDSDPHLPETLLDPIQARLVKARPLRRVIRLSGGVDATVEYDGWGVGNESISVNGKAAERVISSAHFGHRLGFEIPTAAGSVPAWFEVSIDMLKMSVRLVVAGQVVWSEGSYGAVGGQAAGAELPIPTSSATDGVANLPGASNEPSERSYRCE